MSIGVNSGGDEIKLIILDRVGRHIGVIAASTVHTVCQQEAEDAGLFLMCAMPRKSAS